MNFMEPINTALVNYLKATRNINAVVAELDEVTIESSGCSCSGTSVGFDIRYKLENDTAWRYVEKYGDVIDFLPELLDYLEEN